MTPEEKKKFKPRGTGIPTVPGLIGMGAFGLGAGAYSLREFGKEIDAASKVRRMAAQSRIAQSITNPQNFVGQGLQRSAQGLRAIGPGTPGNLPVLSQGSGLVPRLAGQNFEMLGSQTGNVFTGGRVASTPLALGPAPISEVPVTIRGLTSPYRSMLPAGGSYGTPPPSMIGVRPVLSMPVPGASGTALGVGDDAAAAFARAQAGSSAVGGAGAAESAGLLARLGYAPSGVGRLGAFIRPGLTGLGAAGILGTGYAGGQIAGSLADKINVGGQNSAADRFATGAAFGAPIGAAIGNVIPIPAVGMGIGALAGAGIGGVGSVIKGIFDDSSKANQSKSNQKRMSRINELMDTAGLTDNQRQQYMQQYNTGLSILGDNPSPSDVSALLDATETQIQKVAGSNVGKLTSKDMVALQAAIGQYMQPLIQQQQVSGDVAAQLYNDMAGNMNSPAMANLVRGQAAGYKAQADALSAAYMGAAQNIPASYGLQQMAQMANQQQSTQSADLLSTLGLGQ